jgi:hypothetical protein
MNTDVHGRRGGEARAKVLKPRRRSEISRDAARARWKPEVLTLTQPRDDEELECFVAFYGNGLAQSRDCDPGAVLVRAAAVCRNNACLARMIPVFIWRARSEVFKDQKRLVDVSAGDACALGYFLELAQRFGASSGGLPGSASALRALRRKSKTVVAPIVLFRSMDKSMLREHAASHTSPMARSWNLVVGEPDESFESYFERKVGNAAI